MLYLISMGLHDENDMSLRALEAAKKCDSLYCEFYTSRPETTVEKISRLVGKHVTELKRSGLEENSKLIIKEARSKYVGILVGGDALSATTHISMIMEARKAGIKTRVIHGSSIFTAIAETGLQLYNFGKTTTLPFPEKNYSATSPYDTIAQNKKAGLHTLVLLDTKPDKQMDALTGMKRLLDMEKEKKGKILEQKTKVVAACDLGGEGIIKYDTMENLIKNKNLSGKTPAVIIIPGKLHFLEEEFLEML